MSSKFQYAIFSGVKVFNDPSNKVSIKYLLQHDFDQPELLPRVFSSYPNNIFLSTPKSTNILFVLCKSAGSKRRFVRDFVVLSNDEFLNIKKLWEDKVFQIDNNGKIIKGGVSASSTPSTNTESTALLQETSKPKVDTSFMYIAAEINETYFFANKQRKANPNSPVKIMMVGPSGYGKSTIPKHYADKCGLDFFKLDCATIRDPEEWFGQRKAENGSTMFTLSEFAKKLIAGDVVILLDEINRLETWLTNPLYAILDDSKGTQVYDGVEVKLGKNIVIIATMNLGHNYSGIFSIDAALLNRFEYICEVGNMPFDKESEVLTVKTGIDADQAKVIISTADSIRALNGVECSIRTTLMIANQVSLGMTVRNAFQTAVILRCSNQTLRKQVIDIVNRNCGMYKPSKSFFS